MARIDMKSTDIQRGWRDMLNAIIRGDEVVITHYGRPVALVSPYEPEETPSVDPDAGATTEFGNWHLLMGDSSDNLEDYVALAGITDDGFEVAAVVEEFRQAVASVLPDGVTLHGEMIYGPYDGTEAWHAAVPEIRQAIGEIDLWGIAAKHDRSARSVA